MKEFTKSAILTYLKSRDWNELCNSRYQSGEERYCQISARSAQRFGRRGRNRRRTDGQTDGQLDGQTVPDDDTLSGIPIPDKLKIGAIPLGAHLIE